MFSLFCVLPLLLMCSRATVPVPLAQQQKISAGYSHACAVNTINQSLKCWGYGADGRLGSGSTASALFAKPIDVGFNVEGVCCGGSHTCVLSDSGQVKCFGLNSNGQLGQVNTLSLGGSASTVPVNISTVPIDGGKAVEVICGDAFSCVLKEGGKVRCFGSNVYGQGGLGNYITHGDIGNNEVLSNPPFGDVFLGDNRFAVQCAAAFYNVFCVLDDGSLIGWGVNSYGAIMFTGPLGYVGDDEFPTIHPLLFNASADALQRRVTRVFANHHQAFALLDDNSTLSWGWAGDSQAGLGVLGNGVEASYGVLQSQTLYVRTPINGSNGDVIDVGAGVYHTCFIVRLYSTGLNQLRCVGNGASGALGRGSSAAVQTPLANVGESFVDVASSQPVHVVAGYEYTLVIFSDGSVKSFGYNAFGQLGTGTTISYGTKVNETPKNAPEINLGFSLIASTLAPSPSPTSPSAAPTMFPTTLSPSKSPSPLPTSSPSSSPSPEPTFSPTISLPPSATKSPSISPSPPSPSPPSPSPPSPPSPPSKSPTATTFIEPSSSSSLSLFPFDSMLLIAIGGLALFMIICASAAFFIVKKKNSSRRKRRSSSATRRQSSMRTSQRRSSVYSGRTSYRGGGDQLELQRQQQLGGGATAAFQYSQNAYAPAPHQPAFSSSQSDAATYGELGIAPINIYDRPSAAYANNVATSTHKHYDRVVPL